MRIAWRTIADLTELCRANAGRVRALAPDVIVGVPRSGMLPASILALTLGLPLSDLGSFAGGTTWAVGDRGQTEPCTARRVLLIEDASGFGRSIGNAVDFLAAMRPQVEVLTCSVYADPAAARYFDLAMEKLAKPRLFEWNWWRSGKLEHCCLDIDGLICPDPRSEDKHDADSYRAFVRSAPMLYRPAKTVGAFVTGRAEAWREDTEAWLEGHGVAYRRLAMHAGPSPRSTAAHAEHKAAVYRASPACLFLESDDAQAEMIARLTGKDALGMASRRLYQGARACA